MLGRIQEHLHELRTSPSPFEFGEIAQRDRVAVRPMVAKGHGNLLSDSSGPLVVMQVGDKQIDATSIAAVAFDNVRTGFNSAWRQLRPGRLCGFLTDSPSANGLAWRVHPDEDVYGIAVTVGSLIRTIISAYRLLCVRTFEPDIAVGPVIRGSSEWLGIPEFPLPGSQQRRDLGVRYAQYGLYAVFFHELAHVLRGHLYNLAVGDAHCVLDEQHVPDAPEQKRLRLYAETDADYLAGRMLAKIALRPFIGKNLLASAEGQQAAFDILVGVTLTFSGFRAVKDCYHSGALRALLFMTAVMEECREDAGRSARWVEERVLAIQELMFSCGILDTDTARCTAQEAGELVNVTLPAVLRSQHDWVTNRPFT